jgi:rRNA small subunit pseudouridine methyltransferase Nep1
MDRHFTLIIVLEEQEENKQNWTTLHQCLLMLFDSPINHAGSLEVYIRLFKNPKIIKLHKEVRIPRTFKRFEQLFKNFLDGCDMPVVQTKDGPARLFQFIGKPLDKILPNNCIKYRIANLTARVRNPDFLTAPVDTNHREVIFIEFGPVDFNYLGNSRDTEYEIKVKDSNPPPGTYSLSHYPLSPALTCVKVVSAFEKALEIF